MPRKSPFSGHSGQTGGGNTRDVKVERIGAITIYKRGLSYYLYYREGGLSQRRRIDGNLAVARATAHKVADALAERRPSPIAFTRASPDKMVDGFLDAVASVQKLALRTQDRYRAALNRFQDYCHEANIGTVDAVHEATVEDFVKWLRGQKRVRNGAVKGKREHYKTGGVKFILATCRTAFNWAARRRMLPPFAENPFTLFPIETLKDPLERAGGERLFSPKQEASFWTACNEWQRTIFTILTAYGLRVGELTHLLVDDVDFADGSFVIRSKPWMYWTVKTGRERRLPLLDNTKCPFEQAIGDRKAGLVFLNEKTVTGQLHPIANLFSPKAFRAHIEKTVVELLAGDPAASVRDQKRAVVAFLRSVGQIPEKAVRSEFMELTEKIGCAEFTRVHDLRHMFSSRAQARGLNPILVQEMLGHTTLDMTRRYSHFDIDTKRLALHSLHRDQRATDAPQPLPPGNVQ